VPPERKRITHDAFHDAILLRSFGLRRQNHGDDNPYVMIRRPPIILLATVREVDAEFSCECLGPNACDRRSHFGGVDDVVRASRACGCDGECDCGECNRFRRDSEQTRSRRDVRPSPVIRAHQVERRVNCSRRRRRRRTPAFTRGSPGEGTLLVTFWIATSRAFTTACAAQEDYGAGVLRMLRTRDNALQIGSVGAVLPNY